MQRMMWAAAVAALMSVAGAPMVVHAETAPAAKKEAKAAKPKAPKSNLTGEYGLMVKELDLSNEQKDQLEAIAAEHKKVTTEWGTQNKEAWTKASADRKSTDEATKKAGIAEYTRLSKERNEAKKQYSDKALAVLTPAQRSKWEAAKLANRTEAVLKRSKIMLTEEQSNQVRSLAQQHLQGVDVNDTKAYRTASSKLSQQVNDTVLTAEQRNMLPAAKPMAKPAEKPAKPAAKPAPKKKAPANDDAGGDEDMM